MAGSVFAFGLLRPSKSSTTPLEFEEASPEFLGLLEDAIYSGLYSIKIVLESEAALAAEVVDLLEAWKTRGKKLSAAHKAKISAALKGRKKAHGSFAAGGAVKKGFDAKKAKPGDTVQTPDGPAKITKVHGKAWVQVEGAKKKWYKASELERGSSSDTPTTKSKSLLAPTISEKPLAGPKKGIPDASDLTVQHGLGGSTGAKLAVDKDGKQYVVKYGASKEHAAAEQAANDVYSAVGAKVPRGRLDKDGAVVNEYLDGAVPLAKLSGKDYDDAAKQLGKHFVLDAVLGNRDVVGPDNMNVLVKDGVAYRIDNGASFDFRAQGGKKEFTASVGELASLRDPSINPTTAKLYKHLTADEVLAQAQELHANKQKILDAVPAQYKQTVSARIDNALAQAQTAAKKTQVQNTGFYLPDIKTAAPASAIGKETPAVPPWASQPQPANKVKVLHKKADILAQHPVGSKIVMADGTELTVTGATTGYVETSGGAKKYHKLTDLAASGATYGPASQSSAKPSTASATAAGPAHPFKAASGSVTHLKQAHPVGSIISTPDGDFKVTKHYTGYIGVEGAPKKNYKVADLESYAKSASSATPGLTTKLPDGASIQAGDTLSTNAGKKVKVGSGYEIGEGDTVHTPGGDFKVTKIHTDGTIDIKSTDRGETYRRYDASVWAINGVTPASTANPTVLPNSTSTKSRLPAGLTNKATGQPILSKSGLPVTVGQKLQTSTGAEYEVVGQTADGKISLKHVKSGKVYDNDPAYVAKGMTHTSAASAVSTGPSSTAPVPSPRPTPVSSPAVPVKKQPGGKGIVPQGLPHAYQPSGSPAEPGATAAVKKSAVDIAAETVVPAPGITSFSGSTKYDASKPPKVGQAVYDPINNKGAVVKSVNNGMATLEYADGSINVHSLSASTQLKAYDPAKVAAAKKSVSGDESPFTPMEGWPTKYVKGENTLKNPSWVAEQTKIINQLPSAERSAVSKYTGNTTYGPINDHLRHGYPISAANKKQIELIDKAMDKARVEQDMIVYRGIGNDNKTGMPVSIKVGEIFQDSGYMSTSLVKGSEYSGTTKFEILLPKGSRGIYAKAASNFPHENEFLLARNQKFIVHEIVQKGYERLVRMEAIVD